MTRTNTTAPTDIDDQEHELFPAALAEDPRGLAVAIEELSDQIRARVEGWSGGAI